jgi:hypothetical protein
MEKLQLGLSNDELRSLDELLEANGLDMEQLKNAPETITHLEMFLHQYPRVGKQHVENNGSSRLAWE